MIISARCLALLLLPIGLTACGGDDDPEPCEGPNGPCTEIRPSANAQTEVQEALLGAQAGDIIHLGAGTYELTAGLSLDVEDVTIRGDGQDETVLSFAGQTDGAEGLLVTADGFTIEDVGVEDTAGDAIKIEGADGVIMRRVRVEWTNGPATENGAYGLYPVQCSNVLIEDSTVIGASDAGVYVGQSSNIIVRRNHAQENVAGIEIENSSDADVYENVSTGNTAGLLVFNLPGLQVKNGARTRVFDNQIFENNEPNFAPEGNIVGQVPTGTGFATIAAHDIEVFDNEIRDHKSVNVTVVAYLITGLEYDDTEYNPYSDTINIHDNTVSGTADEPSGPLGFLLVQGMTELGVAPVVVSDFIWDGLANPEQVDETGAYLPEFNLCFRGNGDADFANLRFPFGVDPLPDTDISAHDCEHPALEAVEIPGV